MADQLVAPQSLNSRCMPSFGATAVALQAARQLGQPLAAPPDQLPAATSRSAHLWCASSPHFYGAAACCACQAHSMRTPQPAPCCSFYRTSTHHHPALPSAPSLHHASARSGSGSVPTDATPSLYALHPPPPPMSPLSHYFHGERCCCAASAAVLAPLLCAAPIGAQHSACHLACCGTRRTTHTHMPRQSVPTLFLYTHRHACPTNHFLPLTCPTLFVGRTVFAFSSSMCRPTLVYMHPPVHVSLCWCWCFPF